jgi:hypothetical protein
MGKNKPRQTDVTEEMIASVLPIGEMKMASDMMNALELHITASAFGAILKHMRDDGFVGMHSRTNRAHLWYRLRAPVITPPKDGRDRIGGFVTERVAVGGSDSGYHGTSQDKPAFVTLPKMPTLKSVEANA